MNKKQKEAVEKLLEVADAFGWCVSLPRASKETWRGLVIGTPSYIMECLGKDTEVVLPGKKKRLKPQ